jgi:arsenical pump membrane protein
LSAANAHAAFSQAWPAFGLVAGLLLIGAAAARDGLFAAAGASIARAPGGPFVLLAGLLLGEAAVTAVLNLDTAVVFMTPVLLHAARRRGLADGAFLYGSVFMANAASLLLPGANLTNLIVLVDDPVSGVTFAQRLGVAWIVSVAITIVFVCVVFRHDLGRAVSPSRDDPPVFRPRIGTLAAAAAAALVLVLSHPALPVLALGAAAALVGRVGVRGSLRAANPALLLGVLGLAVLLGTAARGANIQLLEHAGRWETAWLAAAASVVVNNLPAAVVLSAHPPAHPRALLLGLDLGPNLAVTGSLAAVLWLQVARAAGSRPSALRYTLLGLVLVPLTLTAALLVSAV